MRSPFSFRVAPCALRRSCRVATLLLLALFGAILLAKDGLAQWALERSARKNGRFQMEIGRTELSLAPLALTLQDVRIWTDPRHGGILLTHVPELYLEAASFRPWRDHQHVRLARLIIEELAILSGPTGSTSALEVLHHSPPPAGRAQFNNSAALPKIDRLLLTLRAVKHIDLKTNRVERTFALDLHDAVLTDIQSTTQVMDFLWTTLLQRGIILPARPPF